MITNYKRQIKYSHGIANSVVQLLFTPSLKTYAIKNRSEILYLK